MEPIQYGSTHCPHCEREYAPPEVRIVVRVQWDAAYDPRYCYGAPLGPLATPCSNLSLDAQDAHLVAVLQERDALRAELALVHRGQLSLLAAINAEGGA